MTPGDQKLGVAIFRFVLVAVLLFAVAFAFAGLATAVVAVRFFLQVVFALVGMTPA